MERDGTLRIRVNDTWSDGPLRVRVTVAVA